MQAKESVLGKKICLALLAAMSVAFMERPAASAELVRNGSAVAAIVLPAEPLPVEAFAAQELARHVQWATGAELPVLVSGQAVAVETLVRIGRAAQVERNWQGVNPGIVKVTATTVDLAGRDSDGEPLRRTGEAGTLFAVYDVLNRDLGVRWFWPGASGTYVPKTANVILPVGERRVYTALRFATWRINSTRTKTWPDPESGKKFYTEENLWLLRHRFMMTDNMAYGHAFTGYWNRFHASNPEYFNLLPDGQRVSDPLYRINRNDLISMCVTEPGFIRQLVSDWAGQEKRGKLNVNENDTAGKCVCPRCLAADESDDHERVERARREQAAKNPLWYQELGSLSERYAKFYLAAQQEADKIDPTHELIGCIYANYYEPPRTVKLNRRMIMRFCPPIMFPWNQEKVGMFKRLWQGWHEAGVSLMLRPNFTLDGHGFPLLYYPEFLDCFAFASQHGLVAVDFDSLTGMFAANGLTLYAIASSLNLNWGRSAAEVTEDFLQAFGTAAPIMREYYAHLRQAIENNVMTFEDNRSLEGGNWANFFMQAHHIYTPAVMERADSLLRQARAAATEDDSRARLDFVALGLQDSRLMLAAQQAFQEYQKPGKAMAYAKALRELDHFRAAHAAKGYADIGFLVSMENRHWPRHFLHLEDDDREITGWKICFDPEKQGDAAGYAEAAAGPDWVPIGTDSHWEKQPAGLAWEEKHGKPYKGVAWYAAEIAPTAAELTSPMQLCFGAVDGNAVIYLNGRLLLDRPYPWQGDTDSWKKPFTVPIPDGVLKSGVNRLVVRVEKHIAVSGIWRSVFLAKRRASTPAMSENCLEDGDFGSGALKQWRISRMVGQFDFRVVAHPDQAGRYALRMACTGIDETHSMKAWGRVWQAAPVTPGRKYAFRMRFRTEEGFAGRVEAWLRSGAEGGLSAANVNLGALALNSEWRELTGTIIPEIDTCRVHLTITRGVGVLLIDEVQLYEVKP